MFPQAERRRVEKWHSETLLLFNLLVTDKHLLKMTGIYSTNAKLNNY